MKLFPVLIAMGFCLDGVNGRVELIKEAHLFDDSPIEQSISERGLSLASRWYIELPQFKYDALGFELAYNVSDFVKDENIRYRVFDGHGCQEENSDITGNVTYLTSQITYDTAPLGDGNGLRRMDITLNIDPETIAKSSIYEELGNQGFIYFCVRLSLWQTSDSNEFAPMEVNFIETPVLLIVDVADDFKVTTSQLTDANMVVALAEQGNAVLGYICDNSTNMVEGSTVTAQGVPVRVCIEPTPESLAEGAYLRHLESFSFTRGNLTQFAIEPGTEGVPADELTEINCEPGASLCSFETILNSEFFQTPGIVRGDGLAFLQLGQDSGLRRSLVGQASTLQKEPTRFRFELVALPNKDPNSSAHAISWKIVATVAMAIVFFAAA